MYRSPTQILHTVAAAIDANKKTLFTLTIIYELCIGICTDDMRSGNWKQRFDFIIAHTQWSLVTIDAHNRPVQLHSGT